MPAGSVTLLFRTGAWRNMEISRASIGNKWSAFSENSRSEVDWHLLTKSGFQSRKKPQRHHAIKNTIAYVSKMDQTVWKAPARSI
jgi:hypothetical protein